jgi:hypothetical protein
MAEADAREPRDIYEFSWQCRRLLRVRLLARIRGKLKAQQKDDHYRGGKNWRFPDQNNSRTTAAM